MMPPVLKALGRVFILGEFFSKAFLFAFDKNFLWRCRSIRTHPRHMGHRPYEREGI